MLTIIRPTIFLIACIIFLFAAAPGEAATSSGVQRLGYAIQMGAFADVRNAERLTAKLQDKGIEAFYFRKDNGIYAVRFGDFPTKDKARTAAARLVSDHLITAYYIAPPNEIVFKKPRVSSHQKSRFDESVPFTKNGESSQTVESANTKAANQADSSIKSQPKTARGDQDMGSIAARTAERFVGIPYRWGGNTVVDGMDCSGFVRAVYNLCGVSIPRTSRDQFTTGSAITKNDLQDGDLVFFGASESNINHVGIYVGSGKFVHAPRRGEDIRITSIEDNYFEKRFIGARRYF